MHLPYMRLWVLALTPSQTVAPHTRHFNVQVSNGWSRIPFLPGHGYLTLTSSSDLQSLEKAASYIVAVEMTPHYSPFVALAHAHLFLASGATRSRIWLFSERLVPQFKSRTKIHARKA